MRYLFIFCCLFILGASTAFPQCFEGDCHQELLVEKFIHNPIDKQECLACHTGNSKKHPDRRGNEFSLKYEQDTEMCLSCHKTEIKGIGLHTPVKKGECLSCHDPHSSTVPAMLKEESPAILCSSCHEEQFGAKEFVHGPVAVGACNVCHSSHGDESNKLLTTQEVNQQCYACHEFKEEDIKALQFEHKPVSERCTNCHDPHESDYAYFLKEPAPDLCISCHDEMEQYIDSSKVHSPLKTDRTCLNCHDAHGAQHQAILKNDSYSLCMDCHNQPLKIGNQIIPNMKRLLEDSKYVHGPIREKDCSGCHNPHYSDISYLLKFQYPKSFYAPFDQNIYDLCFQCHSPENILDAFSTELTNFRDDDINLHYLHVNREKGRTCRSCHQTHASDNPSHIRDKVPFGGWELPLNYTKTDSGGTCSPGCHKTKTYTR